MKGAQRRRMLRLYLGDRQGTGTHDFTGMNRVVKDSPLGLKPFKPNNATREVRGAKGSLSASVKLAQLWMI